MNNHERDPLRQFKAETDEHLFTNLHFESFMKERVMQSLKAENKQFSMRDQLRLRWIKWTAGVMTAAAIVMSIIIFASPDLQQHTITQPMDRQPMFGAIEDNAPPLITNNYAEGYGHAGSLTIQQFQLSSLEEAKAWYGNLLLVPSYTPDHFQLDTIQAQGESMGTADNVSLTYVFDDRSYVITQHKDDSPVIFHTEEKADIHGIDASITSYKSDSTFIQWVADGVHYMVSGMLPKEEALLVARSLE